MVQAPDDEDMFEESEEPPRDPEDDNDAGDEQPVFVQFRARGVRGPKTASGHRGRVCWEGMMPRGGVAYLQRLKIGPEAGLCEPLSIWMSEDLGRSWQQVNSTAQTPGQRHEQIDKAQHEHEQQVQAAAMALQAARAEVREAELALEFVKRRLTLEQGSLERLQQEIEMVRDSLEHERRRNDEERELLKAERKQRLEERSVMAQQEALERNVRQELASKACADIQNLVAAASEQFRVTLETNKQSITALKEALTTELEGNKQTKLALREGLAAEMATTQSLIAGEKTLQGLIQASKLNAVTNASELKDRIEKVDAAKEPTEATSIPYLALADKALNAFAIGISLATGKPFPGVAAT